MLLRRIAKPLSFPISNISLLLIAAWLLCMITVPIVRWTLGDAAIYPLINLSVVLQASVVFSILAGSWGVQRTLVAAVVIMVFTLAAESIGSRTGLPFGEYQYTERLQPQIGHVPLLIPLAWFMMVPSAWAVADGYRQKRWLFILVSAAALTAWDLLLDPQMVTWELWQWANDGVYFGIPLSNYAGWLLVAGLLTGIMRPGPVPVGPLMLVYTATWFLEAFGLGVFWGMTGPALVGGLIMGFFVWLGWRNFLGKGAGA